MPAIIKLKEKPCFQFTVVGCGANGSHFFRGLCQDLRTHLNATRNDWDRQFGYQHILLIDGDKVEEKNIGNQLFDHDEVGEYKVRALAERYGEHNNLEVLWNLSYIQEPSEISRLMPVEFKNHMPILISMVDNNATRQTFENYFRSKEVENLIYIDAGVHAAMRDEQSGKMRPETGNNGQIVVGFKYKGEVILESVGGVYPNIMTDTDSPAPGCGVVVQSQPQRLTTNKFAAQIANNIVSSLLSEQAIFVHQSTFDARMCGLRSIHVSREQADHYDRLAKG